MLQSEHQHNIIKFGKTKAGRQHFKCKTCNGTFAETKGTIFYRRRTVEGISTHHRLRSRMAGEGLMTRWFQSMG